MIEWIDIANAKRACIVLKALSDMFEREDIKLETLSIIQSLSNMIKELESDKRAS